jgi:hypothetical protein
MCICVRVCVRVRTCLPHACTLDNDVLRKQSLLPLRERLITLSGALSAAMSESRAYALLLTNSSTNPPPPVHPWEPWLRGQRSRSTCPAVAPKAGALVVGDGGASESREPGKPLTHVNTLKHLGCDWLAGEVFIFRGFKGQFSSYPMRHKYILGGLVMVF